MHAVAALVRSARSRWKRKVPMFRELLNFRGINWWTLLGGLGLNFLVATLDGAIAFAQMQ